MKINMLWTILNSIFLILFNTLFFVLGGSDHASSVWISYGFIHLAYFLLIFTPLLIHKNKNMAIFGYPLFSVSSTYFLLQFVTGIVFILVAPEGYKAALTVQLCMAGLYGIVLISCMLANEYTAKADDVRQEQVAYVKIATAKMKSISESISDKDIKKQVERVYDSINSSPVKSHPSLSQFENSILDAIDDLDVFVSNGDIVQIKSLSNLLVKMIDDRNLKLRVMN
jgi:hypothetical protein